MDIVASLKRNLPPGLLGALRYALTPVLRMKRLRKFLAQRQISRANISDIQSANHLLHVGNLCLFLGKLDSATKYYLAACDKDPETRWVSGRSLLDYVTEGPLEPKSCFELLANTTRNAKYVVPDLEKRLFRIALAEDPVALEALFATIPRGRLTYEVLTRLGSDALAVGRNQLALGAYRQALQLRPDDLGLREQLGVTEFLTGLYPEAEATFASADHQKSFEQLRWEAADSPYVVLDRTWLAAIGHVAFLDTYIKSVKLGWAPNKTSLLVYDRDNPPAGWPLFKFFSEHIKIVPTDGNVDEKIERIITSKDLIDSRAPVASETVRDRRRAALAQPFWYGTNGTGLVRWYGPLGAEVEAAWKAEGRSALFSLTDSERKTFRQRLAQIYGLPEDAWFVLLHVREPGFHSGWHKFHAGTRNADIGSYQQVIDFVISQGGWVVRGGDPSMTPISPRARVIDYATSANRSPEIDIYLCAECAYFVGTNSGFSVIPPVFGKRCALTNWSPIGIPNWYLDDIYIPKLIRKLSENRYLTFKEMYASFTGWSQFTRDYEGTDFVVEDNSAEDLRDSAAELHAEVFGLSTDVSAEDHDRLRRFNEISLAHRGYVGSRMGYRFLRKYSHLFASL
jgi:putative glycosyltransferase (TIGR04372 family)